MKRSSLLLGALVMLICLFFAREQWTSIRGSLLADAPSSPTLARVALRIDPTNTGRTIRAMRTLLRTVVAHALSMQASQAFTTNCGTDACPPSSPSDDFDGNGTVNLHDAQTLSLSLRTLLRCGNGTRDNGESCDDGNTVSFDGCSALCVLERTSHGVCMGTGMCTPMAGSGPDECISNDDCMPSTSSSQISSSEESSVSTTSSSDTSSSDTSSSDSTPPWMLDAERMIIQFDALPASQTILAGQTNVPLLRFRASAKYMPVALTQLPFTIVGTNALYNIHDLRLMADTNGDGIVDTSVAHFHPTVLAFDEYSSRQAKASYDVYIGGLSLNDLSDNIVITKDRSITFEVHADISSTPATSSFSVSLDALRREPHALGAVADYSAVGMQNLTAVTILPLLNATIDSPCTFFTPMISSSAPIASCNIRVSTEQSTTTSFSIQPNP